MWLSIKRCQCYCLCACASSNHQRYVSCDCIQMENCEVLSYTLVVGPNQKAALGRTDCRSQVCCFTVCYLHQKTNIIVFVTLLYTTGPYLIFFYSIRDTKTSKPNHQNKRWLSRFLQNYYCYKDQASAATGCLFRFNLIVSCLITG